MAFGRPVAAALAMSLSSESGRGEGAIQLAPMTQGKPDCGLIVEAPESAFMVVITATPPASCSRRVRFSTSDTLAALGNYFVGPTQFRQQISSRVKSERFPAKWTRFALRKRVKIRNLEPRFDSIETEKALVS